MISVAKSKPAVRQRPAPRVGGPPPVQADTPRFKLRFINLERARRRDALATIFRELHAGDCSDRRHIIRHIERIAFIHRQYPKRYKPKPSVAKATATWVRAVHRHSSELAALLRKCPYGENFLTRCFHLPNITDDLDRLAKGHRANAGRQPKPGGRPPEGFDWLVANLARFYQERTGKPPGRSKDASGKPSGPLLLVVRAVCDLIGTSETKRTDAAIDKEIGRLPDKTLGPPL
jgi:hypothetical protein